MLQHKPYGYGRRGAALGLDHTKQISEQVSRALIAMQFGEVDRHPPRIVPGEQLAADRRPRLILEIEIAQGLPGAVTDDEAGIVRLVDRPGRRKSALGGAAHHNSFSNRVFAHAHRFIKVPLSIKFGLKVYQTVDGPRYSAS